MPPLLCRIICLVIGPPMLYVRPDLSKMREEMCCHLDKILFLQQSCKARPSPLFFPLFLLADISPAHYQHCPPTHTRGFITKWSSCQPFHVKAFAKKVCQSCRKSLRRTREPCCSVTLKVLPKQASCKTESTAHAPFTNLAALQLLQPCSDLIANTTLLWFFILGSFATRPPGPKTQEPSSSVPPKTVSTNCGKSALTFAAVQVRVPFLCVGGRDCCEGIAPPQKMRASSGNVRSDVFATAAKKICSPLYLHCQGIQEVSMAFCPFKVCAGRQLCLHLHIGCLCFSLRAFGQARCKRFWRPV